MGLRGDGAGTAIKLAGLVGASTVRPDEPHTLETSCGSGSDGIGGWCGRMQVPRGANTQAPRALLRTAAFTSRGTTLTDDAIFATEEI